MDRFVLLYMLSRLVEFVVRMVGVAVATWLVIHGINWLYTTTRLIGAT